VNKNKFTFEFGRPESTIAAFKIFVDSIIKSQ
jgi:hypothetical protein